MLEQLVGKLDKNERKLFERGKHLDVSDLLGLMTVRLRELIQAEIVRVKIVDGPDGKPVEVREVDARVLSQFQKLVTNTGRLMDKTKSESDKRPAALEIRWGDFRDLPDTEPDIPLRIDELFGGELSRRRRAWQGNQDAMGGHGGKR